MTSSHALARAGLVVSGAFLISRILGWVRLVVFAHVFPAGSDLDVFFAAFRLPDLMFQFVAAGAGPAGSGGRAPRAAGRGG